MQKHNLFFQEYYYYYYYNFGFNYLSSSVLKVAARLYVIDAQIVSEQQIKKTPIKHLGS